MFKNCNKASQNVLLNLEWFGVSTEFKRLLNLSNLKASIFALYIGKKKLSDDQRVKEDLLLQNR